MVDEVAFPLPEVMEGYAEDCRVRNMTTESIVRYVSAVKILCYFCEQYHLDVMHITGENLVSFLKYLVDTRKNKPKTVQNVFNSLSTFYDYLVFKNVVQGNPIPPIRKRYLRAYKRDVRKFEQRILSVKEMASLIYSTIDIRDRAMLIFLAKTGIRRNELITLDMGDVDIPEGRVTLKPTSKRSNRVVFFDDECARFLKEWFDIRENLRPRNRALFINTAGNRVNRNDIYFTVTKWAEKLGFHETGGKNPARVFSPHCMRHWFTTHLIRSGMPRDYIKELRGDARREAIDIYNHIDLNDLKKAYLASIPKLFAAQANESVKTKQY